jgi:phosphatidylglycerol:prolipoprotein diacylglycerol transferase
MVSAMFGPFVHRIDPVIAEIGGIYLWWYGLSYAMGFLGIFIWFRRARARLDMTTSEVLSAGLYVAGGVLIGGRLVEVVFYEWDFYSAHPLYIPAYWLGGMATHGILVGGTIGTLIYCRRNDRSFLAIADEIVIPGLWIMGIGRIGNFIDGQIVGSLSDLPWAVKFPDVEGFRHPVVLYDGLKNLLLIPFMLFIRSRHPPRGVVFANAMFWYAFLRLFIDLFREYRVETLGIGTGQAINIAMAITGVVLLIWYYRRDEPPQAAVMRRPRAVDAGHRARLWVQRIAFVALLAFSLTIPSDWTQDVPAVYGQRHPGMKHSRLYPAVVRSEPPVPDQSDQD